jgi:hypothetical protein
MDLSKIKSQPNRHLRLNEDIKRCTFANLKICKLQKKINQCSIVPFKEVGLSQLDLRKKIKNV